MAKSIGFMHRGTIKPDHMHDAMKDITGSSDRTAAIIAGSLVEIALTDALVAHLHRDKKITDDLFRIGGAMGNFTTKIHLGLLVGIYGKAAHKDLLIVKDIRNAFAHSLEISGFKSDRIKSWTSNLTFCDRYAADMDDVKNRKRPKGVDYSKLPHKDWDSWVFVHDRDNALQDSRERYIITMQVFMWGLMIPLHVAVPSPIF